MKRDKLLSLVLVGLMTFGITSCGSDNENGNGSNSTNNTSSSNPFNNGNSTTTCQSASSFDDFKNKVSAGSFIQEPSNYTQTYYFVEQEPEIDQGKFLGFIPYNSFRWINLGQFTRSSSRDSATINHEAGSSRESVRNYLVSLLNDAKGVRGGGSYVEILTNSDMIYGIDLCKPIAANPIYEADADTGRRYFYTGTGGSYSNSNFGFNSF